ncbi:hypothetical protein MKX01_017910 [Papaver californicum]|nr:hypothetical protein MKX01_017910 [Papaver californicum]
MIKENCLAALNKHFDDWSIMEIEEPVKSRKIDIIKYNFGDASRYDEKTVALITDDSTNRTQHPITSQLDLKTTVSNKSNWSNNIGFPLNVSSQNFQLGNFV